jgi:hypothetical protein
MYSIPEVAKTSFFFFFFGNEIVFPLSGYMSDESRGNGSCSERILNGNCTRT